jgi:hypothetical protein
MNPFAEGLKQYRLEKEQEFLTIDRYEKLGFKKVANIDICYGDGWLFKEMDAGLMYSDHRSWVYLIVVSGIVYKIGETGNPLGIKSKTHSQPVSGTTSRMGRLANHSGSYSDTDVRLRRNLKESVSAGLVELWAFKCPIDEADVCGFSLKRTVHKDLELSLIRYLDERDALPVGNLAVK